LQTRLQLSKCKKFGFPITYINIAIKSKQARNKKWKLKGTRDQQHTYTKSKEKSKECKSWHERFTSLSLPLMHRVLYDIIMVSRKLVAY